MKFINYELLTERIILLNVLVDTAGAADSDFLQTALKLQRI